jgi:hypothetical protein
MDTQAIKRPADPSAAERMRLYRKRRRQGLQVVRLRLHVTDIDDLVWMGRLEEDRRHDGEALQKAVFALVQGALDEMRDCRKHVRIRSR